MDMYYKTKILNGHNWLETPNWCWEISLELMLLQSTNISIKRLADMQSERRLSDKCTATPSICLPYPPPSFQLSAFMVNVVKSLVEIKTQASWYKCCSLSDSFIVVNHSIPVKLHLLNLSCMGKTGTKCLHFYNLGLLGYFSTRLDVEFGSLMHQLINTFLLPHLPTPNY